jgi:hypothetical protein
MSANGSPENVAGIGIVGGKPRTVTKITASIAEHRSAIAAIALSSDTIGTTESVCRGSFGFITKKKDSFIRF